MSLAEGYDLVFLRHKRDVKIGYFDVDCTIENGDYKIQANKVVGIFEHIYTRYWGSFLYETYIFELIRNYLIYKTINLWIN